MGVEVQLFEVQWPPRSPNLTPLDFCLWGWMKGEVDKEKVNTRDELVARIMNSAAALKQERQGDLRTATRFFHIIYPVVCYNILKQYSNLYSLTERIFQVAT
jgi:hypothetical protein